MLSNNGVIVDASTDNIDKIIVIMIVVINIAKVGQKFLVKNTIPSHRDLKIFLSLLMYKTGIQ